LAGDLLPRRPAGAQLGGRGEPFGGRTGGGVGGGGHGEPRGRGGGRAGGRETWLSVHYIPKSACQAKCRRRGKRANRRVAWRRPRQFARLATRTKSIRFSSSSARTFLYST